MPQILQFGIQAKLLILIALLGTKAGLHLSYFSYCPWTELENEKNNYVLEQVMHFVSTICDSLIIYLTFILTVGYSVCKIDLNLIELKFLSWLPCTRFFFS